MSGERAAYEARIDTLMTDQTAGICPLPANTAKMDRTSTPRLNQTKVLYAMHWTADGPFPESMGTGPFIMTAARFELALSYFMPDGTLEGSVHYELARRALQAYVEPLRHRVEQPANYDAGTTHVSIARGFRMVGRAIHREPYRLEYRFQWEVVFDEEPTF